MEMLSSFRGDQYEFILVVIKSKHVRSCPSFDITHSVHDQSDRMKTIDGLYQ